MIGDLTFYGIYLPALALPLLLAYIGVAGLRWVFGRLGVYRWVWHRSLFNVSLYVIVLCAVVRWSAGWSS
ncbi:DUF1656 domain-containing protein [Paucibacter sp. R3-3]|uniref:DUF1656 domain-containing protein n=1 Tax=Roseateles agri TaxID=3098619 RepID=A0ABU5DF73_9BURK|nr:DUF1656 domain-containing protein [Paucibacter sp. R3-3]MDY0743817.1 DUF1656 domain-containing protein [Paucibacter sp. R3-3]